MKLEVLMKDMMEAMKNGDRLKKDSISSVVSAIKKEAIDKKCKDNITEELVNNILLKEVKTIQEMIDTCPDNRGDLKDLYQMRLEIVNEYAPKLITDPDEIEKLLVESGIELVKNNRGQIMMFLKQNSVDMKIGNQHVSKMLG